MKQAINVVRIIVGVLFIVSGLIKSNDPLGLSYKMQEFFEIWNTGLAASGFFLKEPLINLFQYFHQHSLAMSVIMIALEIMAGAALLAGWKKNFVLNLLLILILFFTFLTAYAFLSGKFKNCGCFGDCLPITPLTSFIKDVVLTVMIIFLVTGRRFIQPIYSKAFRTIFLSSFLLLSIGIQWYVLNYLPVVDCLPFKKGNNIAQQMKVPADAITDSFAIRFIYEKGGQQFEYSPEQLPADLGSYTFVDRVDKLVRKGNAEPPVKGLAFVGLSGSDSTEAVLNLPGCYILFCEHFRNDPGEWIPGFKRFYALAQQKKIPVFVATAVSLPVAREVFRKNGLPGIPLFSCDNTAIRTAARTIPTLYYLKAGTVQEKKSWKEIDEVIKQLESRG
jgi:hypothetical protein